MSHSLCECRRFNKRQFKNDSMGQLNFSLIRTLEKCLSTEGVMIVIKNCQISFSFLFFLTVCNPNDRSYSEKKLDKWVGMIYWSNKKLLMVSQTLVVWQGWLQEMVRSKSSRSWVNRHKSLLEWIRTLNALRNEIFLLWWHQLVVSDLSDFSHSAHCWSSVPRAGPAQPLWILGVWASSWPHRLQILFKGPSDSDEDVICLFKCDTQSVSQLHESFLDL